MGQQQLRRSYTPISRMARFNRSNTPLFEPTVALIGGILALGLADGTGGGQDDLFPCLVLGSGLLVAILLKYLWNDRIASWQRIAMWSLFFAAGSSLAALHRVDPSPAAEHHGERLTFLGRVESIPQMRGRWERSTATLFCCADSISGDWLPLHDLKINLYTDTSARNPRLQIGDLVRLRGRIYAADSTKYDRYMFRTRGITARCFAWTVSRIGTDTTLKTRIELLRNRLGNKLLSTDTAETDDAGSIMQALAVGDQSDIAPQLRNSYSRAGVAHLLSVSGLHVGIIFLILNLLLGWLRLIRRGYIVLGILVILSLCGYAVLTGLSPSAVRAVVMFSLLQIGLMLSRYTNSLNTLCAAALVILLWNPYYVYHIGFQLSFAAMVGIITLYRPIARLWMPHSTVWRWLWSLTLVGLTAQLGTFPLVMYHFGQLQLAGLLLNPLIWFTVPAIIGGSLLYLASDWKWVFVLTHNIADWQNAAVTWTGCRKWAAVSGIELSGWGCASIYLAIIALIVWINRRSGDKTRSYFLNSADAKRFRAAK